MVGLIIFVIIFLILYLIAFFCHKDYREEGDVLWVSKRQWKAIFIMLLPSVIALVKR